MHEKRIERMRCLNNSIEPPNLRTINEIIQFVWGVCYRRRRTILPKQISLTNDFQSVCSLPNINIIRLIDWLLSKTVSKSIYKCRTVQMVTLFDFVWPSKFDENGIMNLLNQQLTRNERKKNVLVLLMQFKQRFICFTYRIKVCFSLSVRYWFHILHRGDMTFHGMGE